MPAENKKIKLLPLVKKITDEEGLSIANAAKMVGVHPETARKWFQEEGYVTRAPKGRTMNPDNYVQLVCGQCGTEFTRLKSRPSEHCSVACSNKARGPKKTEPTLCPCGDEVGLAPGATHIFRNKKYCSVDCRKKYTVWRKADPENHAAFKCLNCGKETSRRKGLGSHKYCSNECAQKHTKTKKHYGIEGLEVVFDSGYEVLFWGLCVFLKIQVQRFDRAQCIELESGNFYGPDFYLPNLDLYVEVKGFEDEDDRARYAAWRRERPLAVVDAQMLNVLRQDSTVEFGRRLHLATQNFKS